MGLQSASYNSSMNILPAHDKLSLSVTRRHTEQRHSNVPDRTVVDVCAALLTRISLVAVRCERHRHKTWIRPGTLLETVMNLRLKLNQEQSKRVTGSQITFELNTGR